MDLVRAAAAALLTAAVILWFAPSEDASPPRANGASRAAATEAGAGPDGLDADAPTSAAPASAAATSAPEGPGHASPDPVTGRSTTDGALATHIVPSDAAAVARAAVDDPAATIDVGRYLSLEPGWAGLYRARERASKTRRVTIDATEDGWMLALRKDDEAFGLLFRQDGGRWFLDGVAPDDEAFAGEAIRFDPPLPVGDAHTGLGSEASRVPVDTKTDLRLGFGPFQQITTVTLTGHVSASWAPASLPAEVPADVAPAGTPAARLTIALDLVASGKLAGIDTTKDLDDAFEGILARDVGFVEVISKRHYVLETVEG